jgi:hypothetical protein
MAHYHELEIHEAEMLLVRFYAKHEYHDGFGVNLGGFSLILSCPQCGVDDTVIVNNPEYRNAAGILEVDRVVLF